VPVDGLAQRGAGVEDGVRSDTLKRAAEHDARRVTAGLGGREPDAFQPVPDRRYVLDADPVQLDVLAVGDVGHVAAVRGGDVAHDTQLLAGQGPAVDADSQHEELGFELLGFQRRGLATRDALAALGVEAEPPEAVAQIDRVDAGEAGVLVNVDDALAHREAVAVALRALVDVERLAVSEGPLALSLARRHGAIPSGVGWCVEPAGRDQAARVSPTDDTRRR